NESAGILNIPAIGFAARQSDEGRPMLTPGRGDYWQKQWNNFRDAVLTSVPGWSQNYPQQRDMFNGEILPRWGQLDQLRDALAGKYQTPNRVTVEIERLRSQQQGLKYTITPYPTSIGGKAPAQGAGATESTFAGVPLEPWESDWVLWKQTQVKLGGATLQDRLE